MMHKLVLASVAGVALIASACSDTSAPTTAASDLAVSMASVYSTAPAGVDQLSTSFNAGGTTEGAFDPAFDGHGGRPGFPDRGDGPGFGLGFMGGGLGGPFLGDGIGIFFGDGFGHFNGDDSCTFSSATGVNTCTFTHDGLTVARTSKYTTAAGAAEQKIDSLTNTIAVTINVSGTVTRRDSSTSTVNEASTESVSGLVKGSTARTVNAASSASETTTGNSRQGAFTATRVAADTTSGLVLPVPTSSNLSKLFPSAGTVIRFMSASVTITGQSPATSSRREQITYDGTATAKVVITQDGTTQNCTLPLPHGRLSCTN